MKNKKISYLGNNFMKRILDHCQKDNAEASSGISLLTPLRVTTVACKDSTESQKLNLTWLKWILYFTNNYPNILCTIMQF